MAKRTTSKEAAGSAGTPAAQLAEFLSRYSPSVATEVRGALTRLRRLVPGAVEMVYDNYNALVIGFGPTERASDAVLSIAAYPRWVTLFFLQDGPLLPDPEGLLKGAGAIVRHIRLESAADLDRPAIRALVKVALARADVKVDPKGTRRQVIKSISPKKRPRRPV
jgi:hypothetical protein